MANLDFIDGECWGEERAVEVEESDIDEGRPAVTTRRVVEQYADDCHECNLRYIKCFPTAEIVRDGQNRIIAVVNPGYQDPRNAEGILL